MAGDLELGAGCRVCQSAFHVLLLRRRLQSHARTGKNSALTLCCKGLIATDAVGRRDVSKGLPYEAMHSTPATHDEHRR
jgi:hypothetical protein